MAQITEPAVGTWTAADLVERFGPIPLYRIRLDPPPGTATEQDVIQIYNREDRLYELIDGILLEKTVGTYESILASLLGHHLWSHVGKGRLGVVLGADGMVRLAPDLVRIPDVAFVSFDRLPGRKVSREPVAGLAPDLAVEVISKGNTPQEMEGKLGEYFSAGVRLVWYLYPDPREVHSYTAPDRPTVVAEHEILNGGDVLPGFSLRLADLFAELEESGGA
jgi:Uma2 family endonuclease